MDLLPSMRFAHPGRTECWRHPTAAPCFVDIDTLLPTTLECLQRNGGEHPRLTGHDVRDVNGGKACGHVFAADCHSFRDTRVDGAAVSWAQLRVPGYQLGAGRADPSIQAAPLAQAVFRWEAGFPQATVGHLERVSAIEATLPKGIYLIKIETREGMEVKKLVKQ